MPSCCPPISACPANLCRFLQPGLLLKGVNLLYDDSNIPAGQPRKSWIMRSWQQREAVADGLAEWQVHGWQGTLGHGCARCCSVWSWARHIAGLAVAAMAGCSCPLSRCSRSPPIPQANPYFAAGRVTVPALQDTFTCQSFFNEVRAAAVGSKPASGQQVDAGRFKGIGVQHVAGDMGVQSGCPAGFLTVPCCLAHCTENCRSFLCLIGRAHQHAGGAERRCGALVRHGRSAAAGVL